MGIFGMLSQGNCEDEDAERLFGAGYYEDDYWSQLFLGVT